MFDGFRFRVFGRGGRASPRTAFSSLEGSLRPPTPGTPAPGLWLFKSKVFRGCPVSKRYSAFSTSMHPIPLPTLQNAAGGSFWAVLAVLRGLDVYAEGMSNGFLSFSG